MSIKLKVIHNKMNNQLLVALSRKKLQLKKMKIPKYINIDKIDMEY